jgi:hypothetical protein
MNFMAWHRDALSGDRPAPCGWWVALGTLGGYKAVREVSITIGATSGGCSADRILSVDVKYPHPFAYFLFQMVFMDSRHDPNRRSPSGGILGIRGVQPVRPALIYPIYEPDLKR